MAPVRVRARCVNARSLTRVGTKQQRPLRVWPGLPEQPVCGSLAGPQAHEAPAGGPRNRGTDLTFQNTMTLPLGFQTLERNLFLCTFVFA